MNAKNAQIHAKHVIRFNVLNLIAKKINMVFKTQLIVKIALQAVKNAMVLKLLIVLAVLNIII